MPRSYVDFHVHIDYYSNYKEIYDYYDKQKIYALFVTNFPEVFKKVLDTFPESKYVKVALGYHPEMMDIKPFNRKLFDNYFGMTKYLGEVGLDYSKKNYQHHNEQARIFNYISQRASEEQKILSIHSRNAENDVLSILINNNIKHAVFHWYTGSLKVLQDILSEGYYLSLNPSMLRSKKGKEIIKSVPLDRILVETDGPYGSIGKRNVVPNDIPKVYNDFEQFLEVENFRDIVYRNLNDLLVRQIDKKEKG